MIVIKSCKITTKLISPIDWRAFKAQTCMQESILACNDYAVCTRLSI